MADYVVAPYREQMTGEDIVAELMEVWMDDIRKAGGITVGIMDEANTVTLLNQGKLMAQYRCKVTDQGIVAKAV
jgi:hypothetical protein